MTILKNALLINLLFISSSIFATETIKPKVTKVVTLPRIEVTKGILYQNNVVWVSRTKVNEDGNKILVFSADGKQQLASTEVPHGINKIYPFKSDTVVVMGSAFSPTRTIVSFLKYDQGRIIAKRITLHQEFLAASFAVADDAFLFSEIGEGDIAYADQWRFLNSIALDIEDEDHAHGHDDVEHGTEDAPLMARKPNEDLPPIRAKKPGEYANAHLLGLNISFPLDIVADQQRFWNIERGTPSPLDDKIIYVDMKGRKFQRIFTEDPKNGLSDLNYSPKHNYVIVSEYAAGNILLIDDQTQKLQHSIHVGGTPRQTVVYGDCIISTDEQSKNLSFIKIDGGQASVALVWDIADQVKHLNQPGRISANAEDGYVYLKAKDTCNSCQTSRSGVVAIKDVSGVTARVCGL